VHLVDVEPSGALRRPIDGDAVPYGVLQDEHGDLLQALAKLLDVEADEPVGDVHVGAVIEHVERTRDVYLQRRGQMLRLGFRLLAEKVVQVLKDGHLLRAGIGKVVAVDQPDAAVDDGLLHRRQPVLAADDEFAERKDEVGLQRQRVFFRSILSRCLKNFV